MKTTVYFRVDADKKIGFGHLFRCISLSEKLIHHFNCIFVIKNSDPFLIKQAQEVGKVWIIKEENDWLKLTETNDMVVLDGYNFFPEYQKMIREKVKALIMIVDIPDMHYFADAIINHTPGIEESTYSVEPYCKIYSGTEFSIVRNAFLKPVYLERKTPSVLITFGGADPYNLTKPVVSLVLNEFPELEIDCIVNSSHPQFEQLIDIMDKVRGRLRLHHSIDAVKMVEIIDNSTLAILPPSMSAYECAMRQIPMIVIKTASNQEKIFHFLKENKIAEFIESPLEIESTLASKTRILMSNEEVLLRRNKMKAWFDHKSGNRLKKIFTSLESKIVK